MKTANALVTYTDLTTMGLVAKGTPATGNRIATKQFIVANYYVDENASPFAGYSALRCPPYQSIIAGSPVSLSVTPGCAGGEGTGTVLANNFSGGTESFEYITISSVSSSDALTKLDNPATRILLSGATEYTFTSLGNATYYVAIMDFGGNKGVSTGAVVSCTTPCPGANWVASGSFYYTCSAGTVTSTIVYIDDRPCSATYNQYKLNDVIYVTNPGNAYPSTTQVWTDTGNTRCNACVNEKEQQQTNECATGYNTTRWVAGGSACNYAQQWVVLFGTYDCYGTCNKYFVEIQNNPCASGYGTTRQGALNESNSTFCGGCCGQSTAANWQNRDISTYYVCVGVDKYYQQIDVNSCSATYNTTRTGSLYQSNSTDCGYVPPSPINVIAYSAFATYNDPSGDWTVTIQVQLDANVNQDTYIDATINVAGGTQAYGVTIYNGTNIGTANIGYIFDPEPVSPNCLTFSSGDTRVTTGVYTC